MKKMIALSAALCAAAAGGSPLIFSENFDAGVLGWTLEGQAGGWRDAAGFGGSGALMIAGSEDGRGSSRWVSAPVGVVPGGVYGLRFRARSVNASGGTVTTGPDFCNVDIGVPDAEWKQYHYCFTVPDGRRECAIRFGEWECKGDFYFDDIELFAVEPVYRRGNGGVVLGEGESVNGKRYFYNADFGGVQRNHSRLLRGFTAGFNSQRWCIGAATFVEYRHEIPGRLFTGASVAVDCGYYHGGKARVLVSGDGARWLPLGEVVSTGTLNLVVPQEMLPAAALHLRIEGDKERCNLQIYDYRLDADLDADFDSGGGEQGEKADSPPVGPRSAAGHTRYLEKVRSSESVAVEVHSIDFDAESQRGKLSLTLRNTGGRSISDKITLGGSNGEPGAKRVFSQSVKLGTGASGQYEVPFELSAVGTWRMEIGVGSVYAARFELFAPEYFDCAYGALLPCRSDSLVLWQASSARKIPQGRRLPQTKSRGMQLALAANESEAIQLVLRADALLKDVFVSAGDFRDGDKALPAGAVSIERVGYVPVSHPTDATGVIAHWPDPILPQESPCDLPGGLNHPYWIRVRLPRGVAPGIYKGHVAVTAAGGVAERVALHIEVFGFELPDRMSCETAFGLDHNRIFRYHRVKSPEDRRALFEKYLAMFSAYRISPYDPAPLDRWQEKFRGLPLWRGGEYVRGDAARGEGSYKVEDRNQAGNFSAVYGEMIPLPGSALKVEFSHRTDTPRRTLFTLNQQRADGSWISGNNHDIWVESTPAWRREEFTLKSFHPEAVFLRITLWGAGYYEGNHATGITWFDEIAITEAQSGRAVFADGDFESRVKTDDLSVEFDFSAWDRQMERAFSEYHFNTFRCPVKGLGGGTFMQRYEPDLEGLREEEEAYTILLEKYLQGIEGHLRAKGWLDYAYVYWFDEPDPKDYAFVMNGFRKLKKFAPGLRRMLTEQVEPELVGGPNLWCPLTPHLKGEATEERRRAGDQFWWYLCCAPKAPYATLFIDHPGIELRLWLWQSWTERVTGVLVWETVYWHSDTAYPGAQQNPYEDPMAWVSGYGVAEGSREPWGNGDGRFLYPPLAIYETGGPVVDGPNPTVRLEMLRDGLEDYEYFVILRRLLDAKGEGLSSRKRRRYEELLTVPQSVSKSLTDFSTDPSALEQHRIQLARAIEDLSR